MSGVELKDVAIAGVGGPAPATATSTDASGGDLAAAARAIAGVGGPSKGGGVRFSADTSGGDGGSASGSADAGAAGDDGFAVHFQTSMRRTPDEALAGDKESSGLGTLGGVFFPCVQNILGVILFLRLPWIAAQAGAWGATLIVAICVSTTVPTALSISAIATNGRIPAGGPYYVVSRNLGPEFGGAIGICFYIGTTIAASMYVLGAVEAFQTTFDLVGLFAWDRELLSVGVMFLLALTVSVGVEFVAKVGPFFLVVVIVSIVSAITGLCMFASGLSFGGTDELGRVESSADASIGAAYEEDEDTGALPSFTSLLALFYPSVTGIMAGSNRSGVLADPGRSIPKGTLGAITVTTVLYLAVVWLFAMFVDNATLKSNKLVVSTVAWPLPTIVGLGIVMSSLGAGLQSLTGAPQLLASIAKDDIMPFLNFLNPPPADIRPTKVPAPAAAVAGAGVSGPGSGAASAAAAAAAIGGVASGSEEARAAAAVAATASQAAADAKRTQLKAIWVTWLIASLPCLGGNLDFITPPQTIFFLSMYMAINLACFVLALLRAPSFRPTWPYFHWLTALWGVVACVAIMVVVSWPAALGAMCIIGGLYKYVADKTREKQWGNWGDSTVGIRMEQARTALLAIEGKAAHAKNWRPQMLVLTRAQRTGAPLHPRLLSFAGNLKKGRGLTIVGSVFLGNLTDPAQIRECSEAGEVLAYNVRKSGIRGFTSTTLSESIVGGIVNMTMSAGLGQLQPNSVLLNWPSGWKGDPSKVQAYVDVLKAIRSMKKSLFVLKGTDNFPDVDDVITGTIDVWWIVHDGGLLLLMPFLLTRHKTWRGCRIRLFSVLAKGTTQKGTLGRLKRYLADIRISAEVIVVSMDKEVVADALNGATMDMQQRYQYLKALKANSLTVVEASAREKAARARSQRVSVATVFAGLDDTSGAEVKASPAVELPRVIEGSSAEDEAEAERARVAADSVAAAAVAATSRPASAVSPAGAGHDADDADGADGADGAEGAGAGGLDDAAADAAEVLRGSKAADDEDGPPRETLLRYRQRSLSAIHESDVDALAAEVTSEATTAATDARIAVATRMNAKILEHSSEAALVVTNLPLTRNIGALDFMQFVDRLLEGLPRVFLVRGSGREVVDKYA